MKTQNSDIDYYENIARTISQVKGILHGILLFLEQEKSAHQLVRNKFQRAWRREVGSR